MTAERELIAAIRARAGRFGAGVRFGVGDDCAVVQPRARYELVVTTHVVLEGRHFRREWHSPESVGHRCMARGLSDIAAMGAKPLAVFLSIAVPAELVEPGKAKSRGGRESWMDRFMDGLLALAGENKVPLAGGDTAQSPGGVLTDIVVLGEAPRGESLLRSGAKAGDVVYVTGALGGSAAELAALEHSRAWRTKARRATREDAAAHPQLFPQPRIAAALGPRRGGAAAGGGGRRVGGSAGVRLVVGGGEEGRGLAAAAIDVSDGLSTDLDHLCEESKLRAEVDAAALPVDPLAVKAERQGWAASALKLALNGGEDYELLFTARPETKVPKRVAGVPVRAIGRMLAANARKPRMVLRHEDGSTEPLAAKGWEHFRKA